MGQTKTLVTGLTGQTGAGKSTLSRMFSERGVEVIDADVIAREAIETSSACLMDLVLEFSTEVIHPNATLNREKLAMICFSDKRKLKRLNEITFPYIIAAIGHKLEEARARAVPMVVLDAPTLYESGLDKQCDRVIAVIADKEVRTARIIERDSMTGDAARRRVNAQNADEFYTSRAHDIIINNEDLGAMRLAFVELYTQLENAAQEKARAGEPEETPAEFAAMDAGDFEELAPENE